MRALAAVLMMAASPVAAFDTMTRTMCQDSWAVFADYLGLIEADMVGQTQSITATPQGWCRIKGQSAGFEDAQFATFDWRSDDNARWTEQEIPPLGLQIRITGLDLSDVAGSTPDTRRDLTFDATLRQEPAAGQIILERAVLANDMGDELAVSGVIERVFLSSTSMMQVSIGSAAFKAGLVTMTLEGRQDNPFGFAIDAELRGHPQARQQAAFDLISRLPEGVIDDATRAELMAYAGDLPSPAGTLEISAASERGLGLMQLGASVALSFAAIMEDASVEDAERHQLEILLDGVTISADWTPAAPVAD
ncbi:hypothetical protein [Pseudooctadecabacter sp.]|uniref:hypothetical protein n=1 Tax=Pseudooctadecabacter sp. TaxID=1966338 RepID=UPI0035C7FF79